MPIKMRSPRGGFSAQLSNPLSGSLRCMSASEARLASNAPAATVRIAGRAAVAALRHEITPCSAYKLLQTFAPLLTQQKVSVNSTARHVSSTCRRCCEVRVNIDVFRTVLNANVSEFR